MVGLLVYCEEPTERGYGSGEVWILRCAARFVDDDAVVPSRNTRIILDHDVGVTETGYAKAKLPKQTLKTCNDSAILLFRAVHFPGCQFGES